MLFNHTLKIAAITAFTTYVVSQYSVQAAENPLRTSVAEDATIMTIIGPKIDSVISHATYTLPDGDDTSSVLRAEEVPAELILPTNPSTASSGDTAPNPLLSGDIVTGPIVG